MACLPTYVPSWKKPWPTPPRLKRPLPSATTTWPLEAIRKAGKTTIYMLNATEQAAWRKALLPVQKEMEPRIGKELIAAINKEAAK